MQVRAKKRSGTTFLRDHQIASDIVDSLVMSDRTRVLGSRSRDGRSYQISLQKSFETYVVEIDRESVSYLKTYFPEMEGRISEGDFCKWI